MGGLTILALYELEERRREVVAKLTEGLMELLSIDRARVVPVEVTIYVLPVLDVLPETRELEGKGWSCARDKGE